MTLPLSEADLQRCVIDLAQSLGWRVVHFRPAETKKGWRTAIQGDAGFVDLVLAKDGQVLLVELKSATGTLDDEQKAWGRAIGATWHLWRPMDWYDGTIDRALGLGTKEAL